LEATLRRLDVQSAELSLRLYELDLQKIDDINKQMAGLYSNAEVDRFRANVEMAKQRVKAARERADGKRGNAIVGVGQTILQSAQDTYARDMAANRQLSSAIKPVDVERDRVSVEMAKVNLDKAKLVDQLDSPIAIVNWELDVLRDEVRQLRWRITAITSRR
jgi:outer membrane murein-binding lipoprotein Lpp